MEAFRNFDFDNNPGWIKYKSSLEIPAGKDVEKVLTRFKARWYQREVDPDFELTSVKSDSQSNLPSQPQPAASGPAGSTGVPQGGHSGSHRPSSANQAAPTGTIGKLLGFLSSSPEDRLFFLHAALIVFAMMHLQPIFRVWSYRAWAYFLQTALLTHGYKVYLKHGAPRLWPFSFAALKQYFVPVSASTDFQYAMLALVFLPAKPIILVMVPIVTLAVYHFFAYASRHFNQNAIWRKYGAGAHQWLVAHQQQALLYNAAAEIGAGFLVVLSLFSPPRSFFLIFIYWQFLRMRYWSPDAANYHRMAWSQLDSKFGRYLDFIPILKMPVGYLQRWFQNAPGR